MIDAPVDTVTVCDITIVVGLASEGVAIIVDKTVAVCICVIASVTVFVVGVAAIAGVELLLPPSTATTEYDGDCGILFSRRFLDDQKRGKLNA